MDNKTRLYELLAKTNDPKDIEKLFSDLCTKKEVENMAERLHAAELLLAGTAQAGCTLEASAEDGQLQLRVVTENA